MSSIRLLPTKLVVLLIRFTFFWFKLFPIVEKRVVFASYRAEQLSGNMLYVHNEIMRQVPDIEVRYLFKKLRGSLLGKLDYVFHMLKASYYLATAKHFIIDDYYFPVYCIKPRKGMDIVQLWHAAGAFKKFGHSTIGKSFGPSQEYLRVVNVHSNYSKLFVSSSEIIPFYAEAFQMEEQRIRPLGVPRTDYFFDERAIQESKERFYTRFPQLKEKKLLLYAPTFRGKSHQQDVFELPFDIELLQKELGSEYALLVHLHPYMKGALDAKARLSDFVFYTTELYDIQELLVISDILISDYSSVVFDYSLLEKPIAFFANDLKEYIAERDFYYEYESFIPGPFFSETPELIGWIQGKDYDLERIKAFKNRFFDYSDGQASKRIARNILFGEDFTKRELNSRES